MALVEIFMPHHPDPASNLFLTALFQNLEVGILVADDDAVYVEANAAACNLYRRKRSQIVGHPLHEFVGARADEVSVQWKAFLRDGSQSGVFAIELPGRALQHFQFHAQANFVPGRHCSFITPMPSVPAAAGGNRWLTVCAWTKRVLVDGKWVSMEDYLLNVHGLMVTHGICPDAFSLLKPRLPE